MRESDLHLYSCTISHLCPNYVIIKIANFFLSEMNVGYAAECLLCTVYACRLWIIFQNTALRLTESCDVFSVLGTL